MARPFVATRAKGDILDRLNFSVMNPLRKFPRPRGNVVLTALFIAVFLFFLSVALLVANKQDIALSLSMEHKLKAEIAARSVAFEAYGHLREHGKLSGALGLRLEKDVTTRVELVELPATERRGKLLDIRARGTSGPFSSYYTLRLQPTELTSAQDSTGKVMFLPPTFAVYGNFQLVELDESLPTALFANEGPAFTVSTVENGTRPVFQDTLPVFSEAGELEGVGPLVILGPPPTSNTETALQWLEYEGGAFQWQPIPPPDSLSKSPAGGASPTLIYEMAAGANWTHSSAHGEGAELLGWSWVDTEPPTSSVEEIQGTLTPGLPVAASPLVSFQSGSNQQFFSTRGAIAAQGADVYSHGWHYLYQPYRGGVPSEASPLTGSLLIRWPCVLRYSTKEKGWTVAWTPLRDDGSVKTSRTPDPGSLWVTSAGEVYSLTSSGDKRLMLLKAGGDVEVKDSPIPEGQLFFYRDQPWVLTAEPSRLLNLENQSTIDFHTLPSGVPGYHGTMLDIPQFQSLSADQVGTNDLSPAGAMTIEGYKTLTVLPDYLIGYSFADAKPVVCGNDLFLRLDVSVEGVDSPHELYDEKYIEEQGPRGGPVLARYDGERWHVLPNGLRAFLERERQQKLNTDIPPSATLEESDGEEKLELEPGDTLEAPPGMDNAVVATYSGLPALIPRYSVISVCTDPFPMGDE